MKESNNSVVKIVALFVRQKTIFLIVCLIVSLISIGVSLLYKSYNDTITISVVLNHANSDAYELSTRSIFSPARVRNVILENQEIASLNSEKILLKGDFSQDAGYSDLFHITLPLNLVNDQEIAIKFTDLLFQNFIAENIELKGKPNFASLDSLIADESNDFFEIFDTLESFSFRDLNESLQINNVNRTYNLNGQSTSFQMLMDRYNFINSNANLLAFRSQIRINNFIRNSSVQLVESRNNKIFDLETQVLQLENYIIFLDTLETGPIHSDSIGEQIAGAQLNKIILEEELNFLKSLRDFGVVSTNVTFSTAIENYFDEISLILASYRQLYEISLSNYFSFEINERINTRGLSIAVLIPISLFTGFIAGIIAIPIKLTLKDVKAELKSEDENQQT